MRMCDILGIGAISVDDFLYLDAHPAPDSKMPVRHKLRQGGGLTATALIAAARLGASTAFASILGRDELSQFSLQSLQDEGVDCTRVRIEDEARPRHSTILVDGSNGGRCILSSKIGVVPLRAADVLPEWMNCRILFVDHTAAEAAIALAQMAHEHGIPVVADIERVDEPAIEALIRETDHLIVNLDFGRRLTGEDAPQDVLRALQLKARHDAACCALTDGARGCYFLCGGEVRHLPAFKVEAIDTTGCGDAFHGTYAAELARGTSVEAALRTASACAAMNARHQGGRSGLPTRRELEAFLLEVGS